MLTTGSWCEAAPAVTAAHEVLPFLTNRPAIGVGPARTIGERASGAPVAAYGWWAAAASSSQAELDGIHTSGCFAAAATAAGSCAATVTGPQTAPYGLSVRAAASITGAISG